MTTPVFGDDGLAIEPGNIRCFYYSDSTREYTGWSDEYIYPGVSMPGNSTDLDPGDESPGFIAIFTDGGWVQSEDHRGESVYSTATGDLVTVNYIGPVGDGFTELAPSSPNDKWDGEKWVVDADAQHAADVEAADQQKAALLVEAQETISFWQTELQLGIISDEDKASLITWVNYIKAVKAVDTSTAPNIIWPTPPAV